MPLRKQRIGQRKNHVVGIGHETAQGALGNEMCIVIECQKNVDRAGADRKRRNQATNQRPGAFGSNRGREQKPGGYGHFDDEREREIKVGGHLGIPNVMPAVSRPNDGVRSYAYVAGIHVFTTQQSTKTWMAGTSPAMKSSYTLIAFTSTGATPELRPASTQRDRLLCRRATGP